MVEVTRIIKGMQNLTIALILLILFARKIGRLHLRKLVCVFQMQSFRANASMRFSRENASKARDENTFLTNKETANFGRLSM